MHNVIPAQVALMQAEAAGGAAAGDGGGLDLWGIVVGANWLVLGVLILLAVFSVICWVIILYKGIYLRLASSESSRFLETFWQARRLDAIYQAAEELKRSPISQVFKAGYAELSKLKGQQQSGGDRMSDQLGGIESVERALRRASMNEVTALESMVPFLATTGNTAPFIGLFGTVLGIVDSFDEIGRIGAANFTVVAPGIAHALIATAVGLFAAIPAVIAYNYFVRRVRVLSSEMEAFSNEFLNIVQRHFLR